MKIIDKIGGIMKVSNVNIPRLLGAKLLLQHGEGI